MAWGADTASTQLTSITTEVFFSQTPQLNPGESAHCQVEVNFPTTPTDDAIVAVYGTLDTTSENWDDTPLMEFTLSNAIDPNARSFVISGVYKFRVGVRRTGTTDTLTSADMSHRVNGISL